MRRVAAVMAGTTALLVAACGGHQAADPGDTEILAPRAWRETLSVEGEIKAAASTPLNVPGDGWDARQLVEMVPEGSVVRKGQVLARFDAPRSRMELSQAQDELLRKALNQAAVEAAAAAGGAALAADRAKVDADLYLSRRYAEVDLSIFTRSKILDALQDVGFLSQKRDYLEWKSGQVQARAQAQRAVIDSQRASVTLAADQQRRNLAGLELVAPHDGVFLLVPSWDGGKPEVGASRRPGEQFGALPDLGQLVASFSVPEARTYGLRPGLGVTVRLAGSGQEIPLAISDVSRNASIKSGNSPVKFSDVTARIDGATVARLGLQPGQAVRATVTVVDQPAALTVPNIALIQDGNRYVVLTSEQGKPVRRPVELGVRGQVRSELKSGLAPGARILLLPEAAGSKP